MHKIGILSDTHGLLRPEVIQALQGCEAILHGGDINRQDIIDQLNTIAPVYVVRGNNDKDWAEHIPMFLSCTATPIATSKSQAAKHCSSIRAAAAPAASIRTSQWR